MAYITFKSLIIKTMKFTLHKDMYEELYYSSIFLIPVWFLDPKIQGYLITSLGYNEVMITISRSKDNNKLFIWIGNDRLTVEY